MTREQIKSKIYNPPHSDDMWLISVVWLNKMGDVEDTYCYFYERYWAEKWFSEFVADGRPYYGKCCGKTYFNKIEKLIDDIDKELDL